MAILEETVTQQESIHKFEDYLSNSLGEVEPDPRFVGHLRSRLSKKPEVEVEHPRFLAAYFVIGFGLFSGVLLFWLVGQIFKGIRVFLFR